MTTDDRRGVLSDTISRRGFLGTAAIGAFAGPASAQNLVDLHLPGGNGSRPTTNAFPGKTGMILQRNRPPLLETPMSVFDRNLYTPNDQFFVRWHWAGIPTSVDVETFRLRVGGHVARPLSIGLAQLLRLPRIEYAAVNPVFGQQSRVVQPARRRRPVGARRDGQCALDGGAAARHP